MAFDSVKFHGINKSLTLLHKKSAVKYLGATL